ncbi:MAG: hypothetical protein NWQ32_07165, partial [Paracoccaceae bacterium]|nr:hypothetical protein [Paracoccaceae bacterium]
MIYRSKNRQEKPLFSGATAGLGDGPTVTSHANHPHTCQIPSSSGNLAGNSATMGMECWNYMTWRGTWS